MTTYKTYSQVGLKEDVSDIISNISPTKTPFQSSIRSEKVGSTKFEWQEDSLRAVQTNAQVEGFTASDATLTPTVMRENRTQIFEKTVKISATSDAVKAYGRAKETAYQIAKAMAEVKRDKEHAYVGLDQAAVAGDDTTARQTASAYKLIGAATTITTDADAGTGGNQAGPLTEANVLACAQAAYNAGADPSVLMIKPADSLIVAGFANSAGRERAFNDGTKTLTNVVNLYVSPFGELKVVLNRFMKATEALIYDPDMWSEAQLRGFTRERLAKDGDNEKHMIVGEYGLKHKNFTGSGRITNLT